MDEIQEKMVEDNIKLAYFMTNKWYHKLRNYRIEYEDIKSECLLGLVKACKKFDSNRGIQFCTYACKIIDNQILMLLRKEKRYRDREFMIESYNEYGDNIFLGGSVCDNGNDWIKCLVIREALDLLNEQEIEILFLYYKGYNQREISKIYDITQSYISRILSGAREKIKLKLVV